MNETPAPEWVITRRALLCGLLVKFADDDGICRRSLLVEHYSNHLSEFNGRPDVATNAEEHDYSRRRDQVQSMKSHFTSTRWYGLHKESGSGRKSSDYLARDLVRLEKLGGVKRIGEDAVKVTDWHVVQSWIEAAS